MFFGNTNSPSSCIHFYVYNITQIHFYQTLNKRRFRIKWLNAHERIVHFIGLNPISLYLSDAEYFCLFLFSLLINLNLLLDIRDK